MRNIKAKQFPLKKYECEFRKNILSYEIFRFNNFVLLLSFKKMIYMNKNLCYIVICLSVMQLIVSSCGINNSQGDAATDELKIEHISKADSTAFSHDANKVCNVKAMVNAEYPVYYVNDTLTHQLQVLYINEVLGMPVNGSGKQIITTVFDETAVALTRQFGDSEDEILYGVFPDKQILNYVTSLDVSIVQDSNGIVSFCRHEEVNKDGKLTADSHHYINIDLQRMRKIDIYNLFNEEALSDVSNMLKSKLLKQMNAKNEEELIGMGYFNLDNITVNSNFYFGENGVTWNYVTYEIACYSVGETQITLDYASLAPYISTDSVLSRFLKTA